MRSFLLHAFAFGLLVLAMIGAYCWMYREYFPAPYLTSNISLNQQLQRVKRIPHSTIPHGEQGEVNILAVGSSMSLNNLHSRAVLEHFGDSSFVNVGAWSTRIHQTASLAPLLMDHLKPHTLLLTSNMEDWMNFKDFYHLDTARVWSYLNRWSDVSSYLHTMRPTYYLREMERNRYRMTDPTFFDFLGFDTWGGATLNVPEDRVEASRLVNTIPRPDQVDHTQYPYLAWLAAEVDRRGIRMIYIQSPYRESAMTEELKGIIAAHEARVQEILAPYDHIYLSANDRSWPNEMYIDPSHFRGDHAYEFTHYVLGKLTGEHRVPGVEHAAQTAKPQMAGL